MKINIIYKSLLIFLITSSTIEAGRCCGGSGFWDIAGGTFVGSTFGTALGNAISSPRRNEVVVVNPPPAPVQPVYYDDNSDYLERRAIETERRKTELELIREKNKQKALELEERRLKLEERKTEIEQKKLARKK